MNGLNRIGSFRPWVKRMMPTVYDDSLTYYEILIKTIKHLNEVIENQNIVSENFEEFVKYVEEYISTLDVQDEINKKLDSMVADGTLDNLFYNIFGDILKDKADIYYVDNQIAIINDMIGNIITEPVEGVSEQEIIDAREGKNTLGDNIRDIRKRTNVDILNVVEGGDFRNGLEGKFVNFGDYEFRNGNILLTETDSTGVQGATINKLIYNQIPSTEVWYYKARLRAEDLNCAWLGVGARGTTGQSTGRIYEPEFGVWYEVSHYMTPNEFSDLTGNFSASAYGAWTDPSGKRVEVDYFMAINVTNIYGRGNEPSKEVLDDLLKDVGYFEGDLSVGTLTKIITEKQTELSKDVKDLTESDLTNVLSMNREDWVSWSNSYTTELENGNLMIRGNNQSTLVASLQDIGPSEVNHKYYVSGDFKPSTNLSSFGFSLISGETSPLPTNYLTQSNPVVDEWNKVSGIISTPETSDRTRVQVRTVYNDLNESSSGTELANMFVFDLTSFFGYGNEPSSDEFKIMLDNLSLKEGKMKTNETQKALTQLMFNILKNEQTSTRIEKPLAVVSFDDNNLSDYEKAFPFLKARGIKGTVYVITSNIGNSGKMDWSHLHELRDNGWEIGFHSHNHINLDDSSDDEIIQDFEEGIQAFKDNGFPAPRHLAYPFGAGTDSQRVRNVISQYVKTARNSRAYFSGVNNPYGSIDPLRFNGLSIDMNEHRQDRIDRIKQMMDYSRENREIVCLYAHKLVDSPPTNDITPETIFEMWAELIDYAIDLDYEFVNMNEAYLRLI